MIGRIVPNAPQDAFVPQFDDDGNQTLIKTATGIWQIQYNGENRPILWICQQSDNQTITNNQAISMSYDRMGRRVTKNNQRFVYDGYLQIANSELETLNSKLQTFIWDPSAIVATRPLVWQCGNSVEYYTHDGNKNVSEVVAENGDVAAHYEYAPFGAIVAQRGTTASDNPWRFSNEYADDDTGTVYYNYRHYEPVTGRWLRRDILHPIACLNPYGFKHFDFLGLRMIVRKTDDLFEALDFLEKTARFHGKFGWHPVSPYSRAEGERKNQKCCAITGKDTEYFRWLKIKYEPVESDYEIDMVDWKHGPNVKEEDQKIYDKLFDIVFDHEDEHRKIYETHLRLLEAEFQEEDSNCVKDNVKSFNDLEELIHAAAKKEFNKKKTMHDVAQDKFDQEELESGRHAEFNKILTEYKDKRK
jgi:RHS repeat-associated protein